jgi:hypothetical protein
MSVQLLRLRRGTSEQNSRAIESKVRSIMSTHFADLSIHFDVNSATKYIIELVPREDDSVSDFEANTGETFLDRLEALKTRLIADMYISYYADMSTVLDLDSDSEEESDDGLFVPEWTQAASSTPQPAATYQYGRDTGNTAGLFGRPGTTVVSQRRPPQGQFAITPFHMDASSDDGSYHSTTGGVGDPGSGDDSDDSGDSYKDAQDDDSSADAQSSDDDESMDDARDTVGNYEIKDHYDLAAFNRAVDNAEMRTVDGEPETTEQRDLAKRIAKAIAGTSSFTKADTLDKNGKPKPLSELMRMARVTSLWPVLSELQKDQYMQTTGVLAHDRHYIARNVQFGAPIRKKRPFVINAQGQKIQV